MLLENEFGITYNRKRIQRIMRKYNIVCPIRKANPYRRMAKATKEHRVVPNLLNRNFKQEVAGKVLLTDITYLPYGNNQMAYLSTIKDASKVDKELLKKAQNKGMFIEGNEVQLVYGLNVTDVFDTIAAILHIES